MIDLMNRWIRLSEPAILFYLLSFLNQFAASVELGFVDYAVADMASSNWAVSWNNNIVWNNFGLEFKI